jgi:hypothetical protein
MNNENIVEETIDRFNFDRVHDIMILMDWTWFGSGTPSADELKNEAKRLLNEIIDFKGKYACVGTGGLWAYRLVDESNNGEPYYMLLFSPEYA